MNLKEKLARLERSHQTLYTSIEKTKSNLNNLLPGQILETENATCWLIKKKYDLSSKHGSFLLNDFFRNHANGLQLVAKNRDFQSIRLDQLIFVDTETTGLSGGIGTVAFLIGMGYFTENNFVIDQYFMRDFHEETGVLNSFLQRLKQCHSENGAIVSFNGKSYDLPLILNRSIFHRFFRNNPKFYHIDLLHPSRRFWKNYFPDCTLGTLECNLLNIQRNGDVPGYMIPEIYFKYLRNKDPRPLLPVFYHNQMDILSLVGLLHLMLQCYQSSEFTQIPSIDWLAVGSAYDVIAYYEAGLKYYQNILFHKKLESQEKKETLLRIARIYKKLNKFEAAIHYWENALKLPGFSVEPYEELAKVYEHRLENLDLAKEFTLKALENFQLLEKLKKVDVNKEIKQELLWRLQRLERKLGCNKYSFEKKRLI